MARNVSLGASLVVIAGCGGSNETTTRDTASEARIAQIVGTTRIREGDCMPVTNGTRCRIRPLSTRVVVFPVIRLGTPRDFQPPPGISPVVETTSDANGFFSLRVAEGHYTIVANADGEWFPLESGHDEWAPVDVNADWTTDLDLILNHATD
ncbi:hypothetical protein AKJ09_06809 [Labilithrix luteola]|uniref:Lipoprotein n=1 Tax=Labilithrix luteola TaxID=1391654 RepID=A0A0K1Q2V4_9BACT|nr:hypothetical protein AKJ09_06809 [Labilithrix luteola]